MEELTEEIRQQRLAKSRQIWAATLERASVEAEKARVREEEARNMASQSNDTTHEASVEPGAGEADLPQTEDLQLEAAFADYEKTTGQVSERLRAKILINLALRYNLQSHRGDRDRVLSLRQRLKNLLQQHNATSPNATLDILEAGANDTLDILEAGAKVLVSHNAKSLGPKDLMDTETDKPMPDVLRVCFQSHAEDLDWIRNKPRDSEEYKEAALSLDFDLSTCLTTMAHYSLTRYWRQVVFDRAMRLYRLEGIVNRQDQTFMEKAAQLLGQNFLEVYGVTMTTPDVKYKPFQTWSFDEGKVVSVETDESGKESGNEEDDSFHVPVLSRGRLVSGAAGSRSHTGNTQTPPDGPSARPRFGREPEWNFDKVKVTTDERSGSKKDKRAKKRQKLLRRRGDSSDSDDDFLKTLRDNRREAGPRRKAPVVSPEVLLLSEAPVTENTAAREAVKSEGSGAPGTDSNLPMPTPGLPLDAGVPQTESTSQAPVAENTETIEAVKSEEPGTPGSNSNLQVPTSEPPPTFGPGFTEEFEGEPAGSVSPSQASEQLRYSSSLTEHDDHFLTIDRQDTEAMDIDDGNDGQTVVNASAEMPVNAPGLQGAASTRASNVNDDENEDTWENRYYEDAWAYFNQAKIHTKFMKQLDSLDKRICKALTPPSAMVVDTIRHFATKAGHPISSLGEIEEEYYGIGGWKEIASKLGPSTDYTDYKTTYEELEDAFLLKVARLAEDSKRPLKKILHQLRRDLKRCHEPFATLTELTTFLDNALRYAEAEPNAIYQQFNDLTNDLLCMREAYGNLRRGFTKYKCLAKSTREELATALSKIQGSYDGDWATLAVEGRDRHLASMADKIMDPDNMHGLNDLDYMDSWDSIGALMFFRQYQHLQTFIDQADECASYARDLFAVVDEEANAEADREEEAELQQLPDLTQDNLRAFADREENQRQAADRRPDVLAEDEAPDVDLLDAAARAAMHEEDEDEDLPVDDLEADEGDDDGLEEPM
ncbi:hypothetical protein NU195Hw_g7369t1 [Hortaea werneckii]